MNGKLKQRLLTQYPALYEQPTQLTSLEMENPYTVFSFFFTRYSLVDSRTGLKKLLQDALSADGAGAPGHIILHRDVEKLVEATWLIHRLNGINRETEKTIPETRRNGSNAEPFKTAGLDGKYLVIHEFFELFTLPFARDYLLSAIRAAESTHTWNKGAPANLIYFFESLETLLPAVYGIVKSGHKAKKILVPGTAHAPDLTQYHFYCGTYDQHKPWDYFPRSLSAKEYRDPYKALQKFTSAASKKEWKENIRYLLSYALGVSSLSEMGLNLKLFSIAELLQKMLEACHLIYVRTRFKQMI